MAERTAESGRSDRRTYPQSVRSSIHSAAAEECGARLRPPPRSREHADVQPRDREDVDRAAVAEGVAIAGTMPIDPPAPSRREGRDRGAEVAGEESRARRRQRGRSRESPRPPGPRAPRRSEVGVHRPAIPSRSSHRPGADVPGFARPPADGTCPGIESRARHRPLGRRSVRRRTDEQGGRAPRAGVSHAHFGRSQGDGGMQRVRGNRVEDAFFTATGTARDARGVVSGCGRLPRPGRRPRRRAPGCRSKPRRGLVQSHAGTRA